MTVGPELNAPKPKSNWLAWTLGGCGCFVFVLAAFVLGVYFFVMKATAEPEKVIHSFLTAAAAGDADTAHGYFSQDLKDVQSLDQFKQILESNPDMFKVADTKFTTRSRDLQKAEFKGTVKLQSGNELPAEFTLVQEGTDWKLISYQIGSGGQ